MNELTEAEWAAYDEKVRATGQQILKISDTKFFIIDAHGRRLSDAFTSHAAAAEVLITNTYPTPPIALTEAACQHGKAKHQQVGPRKRSRSLSIMEAL